MIDSNGCFRRCRRSDSGWREDQCGLPGEDRNERAGERDASDPAHSASRRHARHPASGQASISIVPNI